jgi:hypothetical protein
MTRAALLIIVLLGASYPSSALPPTINEATARELVRDALASLGQQGTDIGIGPWLYYWAPDFFTIEAWRPSPTGGAMQTWYFAVNPWTGDVWNAIACTRITSTTIKRKQEEIWKSSKLPDEARQFLQARPPACKPSKPERSPEEK